MCHIDEATVWVAEVSVTSIDVLYENDSAFAGAYRERSRVYLRAGTHSLLEALLIALGAAYYRTYFALRLTPYLGAGVLFALVAFVAVEDETPPPKAAMAIYTFFDSGYTHKCADYPCNTPVKVWRNSQDPRRLVQLNP